MAALLFMMLFFLGSLPAGFVLWCLLPRKWKIAVKRWVKYGI